VDRNSVNWRGYMPAITTPFDRNGSLDLPAVARLAEWHVSQGMHGIVVAGTTGEWFSLSMSERGELFRAVGAQVAGRIPVVAGCNAFTARDAIEAAALASEAGLSGILLTPPPYIVPTDAEILEFYRTVDHSVDLPICVYNWPPGTNIDMSSDLLAEIVALDKVVAVKNSTSNLARFAEFFFRLKEQVRVFGVVTDELGLSWVQDHGLDGMMGAGGVLGSDHPAVFNAVWRGELDRARYFLARERETIVAWFKPDLTGRFGSAQAIMKEALNQQGLPGGYPRPPILPLLPEGRAAVRATLLKLRLLPADGARES
jgi:dihydrodipicolinate synthase/N-acetylneuraminate lyase